MAICRHVNRSVILSFFIAMFALIAILVHQPCCAEPLLILYKIDTSKTPEWQDKNPIHQKTKLMSALNLNKNGDLMVKCGGMNVVLAYNQPEDPLKQPEPVRHAMAMNQDQNAPPISGVSISLNFTF